MFFFFQAEDGIRDVAVTGVQTCALPISANRSPKSKSKVSTMRPSNEPVTISAYGRNVEGTGCTDTTAGSSRLFFYRHTQSGKLFKSSDRSSLPMPSLARTRGWTNYGSVVSELDSSVSVDGCWV